MGGCMDCEKALKEKPGKLIPSLCPSIALTLSKPLNFSRLRFFPKDFDQVISVSSSKLWKSVCVKGRCHFAFPIGHTYLILGEHMVWKEHFVHGTEFWYRFYVQLHHHCCVPMVCSFLCHVLWRKYKSQASSLMVLLS